MSQTQMTNADFDACFILDKLALTRKAENFAQSFFFSFTPDEWSFEELTDYLRASQEDSIEDLAVCLKRDQDDLAVWERFEDMNPSWIADQMDVMVFELVETFA